MRAQDANRIGVCHNLRPTARKLIIKVDREERKIALSLRDHQLDSERRHMDEYHATQGALDQSLGRAAKQSRKKGQADDQH